MTELLEAAELAPIKDTADLLLTMRTFGIEAAL